MSYKNSVKLISNNFGLVYKQLLFTLVFLAISVLLGLAFASPTISVLKNEGWFYKVQQIIEVTYTAPSNLNATLREILSSFFEIIGANFGSIWASFIGLVLIASFLPDFLYGLGQYAMMVVLNAKLSSFVNLGFTSSLITNLKSASKYSLFRLLIDLGQSLVLILVFYLYLKLSHGVMLTIIFLILLVSIIVMISSLKLVVLSKLAPRMISTGVGLNKAIYLSTKNRTKQFWRSLSNAIILVLTIIAVNIFFGLFTFFVGLIITIPASMVFVAIFMETNYFTTSGEKFYLTQNLIVEPTVSLTNNSKVLKEKEED